MDTDHPTEGPPLTAPSARSDSISSLASATDGRPALTREGTWREEQAQLHHQLRLAKAEIAHLQGKLGLKANAAPFNSSSPRKSSVGGDALPSNPLRKPSLSDLAAAARRRSVTPEPDGAGVRSTSASPRSAHFPPSHSSPRGPLQLPEGAGHVAMNRALLADEPNAVETLSVPDPHERSVSPTSTSSGAPAPSPSLRANGLPAAASSSSSSGGGRSSIAPENPFFGSGAARERISKSAASAQSGSGKVISALQSDLLQARTALESTRGQLRLSQRAVEFLGRQSEDLKETKERLTNEIDGLNRQITRKERLQEEALGRARVAEAALAKLQQEHRALQTSQKERIKLLEETAKKAEEAKGKADREYASLRDGLRTMSDGWRADLTWLKSDLVKSEKELEAKASTITKLLQSRESLQSTVQSTLSSLETTQQDFIKTHTASTSTALKQLTLLSTRHDADARRADDLRGEFGRLRRHMAEYQDEQGAGEGAATGATEGGGRDRASEGGGGGS
ncbi:hypothetical protein JCM10207_003185 [Rhodosporidiobolus poonsookiae]